MGHPPDVRLVDAHAERGRGRHDVDAVVEELLVSGGADPCGQPAVVEGGLVTRGGEPLGEVLGGTAGGDVDDPWHVHGVEQPGQALRPVVLVGAVHDLREQVGPVQAVYVDLRVVQAEAGDDVLAYRRGGGGRPRPEGGGARGAGGVAPGEGVGGGGLS